MSSRDRIALALLVAVVILGEVTRRLRADLRAVRRDAARGNAYLAMLGYLHDHADVAHHAHRESEHPP